MRAAIANHAFAYHAGSASFALTALDLDAAAHRQSEAAEALTIPEFLPLVRRYEAPAHYRAERLMSGLLSGGGRPPSAGLRSDRDGPALQRHQRTHARRAESLGRALGAHASGSPALQARRYSASTVSTRSPVSSAKIRPLPVLHAVAIRMAQPFDLHHINVLEGLAPINVYAMLDTIAEDCGPLAAAGTFCHCGTTLPKPRTDCSSSASSPSVPSASATRPRSRCRAWHTCCRPRHPNIGSRFRRVGQYARARAWQPLRAQRVGDGRPRSWPRRFRRSSSSSSAARRHAKRTSRHCKPAPSNPSGWID